MKSFYVPIKLKSLPRKEMDNGSYISLNATDFPRGMTVSVEDDAHADAYDVKVEYAYLSAPQEIRMQHHHGRVTVEIGKFSGRLFAIAVQRLHRNDFSSADAFNGVFREVMDAFSVVRKAEPREGPKLNYGVAREPWQDGSNPEMPAPWFADRLLRALKPDRQSTP